MNTRFVRIIFAMTVMYVSGCSQENPTWIDIASKGAITDFAEDDVHIWAATPVGLARINKVTDSVWVYTMDNSDLPENKVSFVEIDREGGIEIDREGGIWIVTSSGLSRLTGDKWELVRASDSEISFENILRFKIDSHSDPWFITSDNFYHMGKDRQISVVDPRLKEKNYNGESYSSSYMDFEIDTKGNKWLLTGTKLIKISKKGVDRFESRDLTNICTDGNDNLWGFAWDKLLRLKGKTWEVYNSNKTGFDVKSISNLFTDSKGGIWFFGGEKLVHFNGKKWNEINDIHHPEGKSSLKSVYSDKSGTLWLATSKGLMRIDKKSKKTIEIPNMVLPSGTINDIAIDRDGILWLATDDGLGKMDQKGWRVYKADYWLKDLKNEYYSQNRVLTIEIDHSGEIWAGANDSPCEGGIIQVHNNEFIYFDSTIYLFETSEIDREGTLWFTARGCEPASELFRGTTYGIENVTPPESVIPEYSYFPIVTTDPENNLWLGVSHYIGEGGQRDIGLVKFDGNRWDLFDTKNSGIPSNSITALVADNEGKIWVGTDIGLSVFDGNTWITYDKSNSAIPSLDIRDLAVDAENNIWIGTTEGLVKFDRERWQIFGLSKSGHPLRRDYIIYIDKSGNKWICRGYPRPEAGLSIFNENGVKFNFAK